MIYLKLIKVKTGHTLAVCSVLMKQKSINFQYLENNTKKNSDDLRLSLFVMRKMGLELLSASFNYMWNYSYCFTWKY